MIKPNIHRLFVALTGLGLLASSVSAAPASTSQLVDLVLEKRLLGELHQGNRPLIDPGDYQTLDFSAPTQGKLLTVNQPLNGHAAVTKRYEVSSDPAHFQSLIRVYDAASGKLRRQISVGRRVQSLVASPNSTRLYVLCGGYFGSVWEIDTAKDIVVRKLPDASQGEAVAPLWNPRNMVLAHDGQTLAVGSGKLQLIDLATGQLRQQLDLPAPAVEVASLQALPGKGLGVGLRDADGGFQRYHLPYGARELESGGGAAAGARSLRVQVRTTSLPAPNSARLMFMASRNSDYVRMIDRDGLKTVGLLPVDFNVDDLTLSPDRKRLFVYNQRFGQISVIELGASAPESYSVIRRFRDKRFQSSPEARLQLGAAAGQVFLWDGENQIVAGFDAFTLYPRMNVSFGVNPAPGQVWVSMPAHQRFYLREGKLYAEFIDAEPSALPMELTLGAPVLDLQMTADRRRLYALTAAGELVMMDPVNHGVLKRFDLKADLDAPVAAKPPARPAITPPEPPAAAPVSAEAPRLEMRPRWLSLSSDDQRLLVIDADQGSLRVLRASDLHPGGEITLDVGLDQPYQISLYDPRLTQLIEVELPRYHSDVVRVAR